MLDKKMAVVVVAITLLSATAVLGASNLIVNGSGIVATEQQAPPEVELLIGIPHGSPDILVITVANVYSFNGDVSSITNSGSDHVSFSGKDRVKNKQYSAIASKIDINTWTLDITYQDGEVLNFEVNGHLQINLV